MRPPRDKSPRPLTPRSPLEDVTNALHAGTLAALLADPGLSRGAVSALLRPGATEEIEALLRDHLILAPEDRGGKVLAFRSRSKA